MILPGAAKAALVYYYDEQGAIHYVNTDFAVVPPQYMDQVRPQLEALKKKEAQQQKASLQPVSQPPMTTITPAGSAGTMPVSVVLLLDKNDLSSRRAVAFLQTNKINFQGFNVTTSQKGQELYRRFSSQPLPLIIINDMIAIPADNIGQIKQSLMQEGIVLPEEGQEDDTDE